jgi:hypothetical protein
MNKSNCCKSMIDKLKELLQNYKKYFKLDAKSVLLILKTIELIKEINYSKYEEDYGNAMMYQVSVNDINIIAEVPYRNTVPCITIKYNINDVDTIELNLFMLEDDDITDKLTEYVIGSINKLNRIYFCLLIELLQLIAIRKI